MADDKIVELLYQHDDSGLQEVKNKYEPMLKSISFQIVKNNEDALECINDTYMKIWDTIPPYKPNYFPSFICKIIRQISIDKYRYNHRQARDNKNIVYLSELDYEVKDTKNVNEEVQKNLLIGSINRFLETLDIESRVLFIRKYFLFEDSTSLSNRYGLTENNINVKIHRIRKKLKKHLESEGYVFEQI